MKKKHIIIIVVVCVAVAVVAIGTYVVLGFVAVNNYNDVKVQAENAVNKGNAIIISSTINTYNVLFSEKILVLPETVEEYYDILGELGSNNTTMNQEDYINAIQLVEIDEDGNAECKFDD